TFPVTVPANFSEAEVLQLLERQGYTRIHAKNGATLEVIQDRLRFAGSERARVIEALEAALRVGQGRVNIHVLADGEDSRHSSLVTRHSPWKYSTALHCPDCDIRYGDPT